MRFDVLDFHHSAFLVSSVQLLPNQDPHVGLLRLGPMHLTAPLHSPSRFPWLSMCTIVGPTAFLRRHKKAVSAASVDGTLHLHLCIPASRTSPLHLYHLLVVNGLHHRPATCTSIACFSQLSHQWRHGSDSLQHLACSNVCAFQIHTSALSGGFSPIVFYSRGVT